MDFQVDTASGTIEWRTADGLVPYQAAVAAMEARVAAIHAGAEPEMVWLVEHPPLYTAGTSAEPADLLEPDRLPVFKTGRGGQYTYHGPGQRVVYVMLDLTRRDRDVGCHVWGLEEWMIRTLARFGIVGERRAGRVGVWVDRGDHDDKIGAVGVRVRHWVTYHGLALNVNPDLGHYAGIVPCGIAEHGVTSLAALGAEATMADVDAALRATFDDVFAAPACKPLSRMAGEGGPAAKSWEGEALPAPLPSPVSGLRPEPPSPASGRGVKRLRTAALRPIS